MTAVTDLSPSKLIAECRRLRIDLAASPGRLIVRGPAGAIPAELRAALTAKKPELIAVLMAGPCPGCGRPVDAERRCWGCVDRACVKCGRQTGSAFFGTCLPCELTAEV